MINPEKGQMSSLAHHLKKLDRHWAPDAIYQDSASKLEKKVLKIGHGFREEDL